MTASLRSNWLAWIGSAAIGTLTFATTFFDQRSDPDRRRPGWIRGRSASPSADLRCAGCHLGSSNWRPTTTGFPAVQYFGTRENRFRDYRDLPRYLKLVQELSPRFCYPYVFAGEAVPYHRSDRQWSNTAAAMALLEPGLEACPEDWRIPFQLAWSQFTFTDRYGAAAENIARASRMPGAPSYLSSLATRLYGQQGDLETALVFAQARLAESTDPFSRGELMKRIRQIELELDLKQLGAAAQAYTASRGRPLKDLAELRDAGILPEISSDPLGGVLLRAPRWNGSLASREPAAEAQCRQGVALARIRGELRSACNESHRSWC